MARIRVRTRIHASPREVWRAIEDVTSHVTWMDDAVAIRLLAGPRAGVGTRFECDTRVGPFRLLDRMEVTEWKEGRVMGIRHVGVVTGTGRFDLRRARGRATRFTWTEDLHFPWWLGGPLAALVGRPVLRRVWRRNLSNLRRQLEV